MNEKKAKKEAIKWIKELREHNKEYVKSEEFLGLYSSVVWLKHFFDIGERDLK